MFKNPFGKKKDDDSAEKAVNIIKSYSREGVIFKSENSGFDIFSLPHKFGTKSELASFLCQLEEEGYAESLSGGLSIDWIDVYRVMASAEHSDSFSLLELPTVQHWRPILKSRGTLIDSDFSIIIAGWESPDGRRQTGNITVCGAIISVSGENYLLPQQVWEVVDSVIAFHSVGNPVSDGDFANYNRRTWSEIRVKAIDAKANLSDFLMRTVVITPNKLDISMRKGEGLNNNVVEVIPGFVGQPRRWLEIFDRLDKVPTRYDIPDGQGITHILISPEVSTVLGEIKRMPGRRIAGDRAEAFIRNPFAVLGVDAEKVVDAQQFEQAREEAGISFARFYASVLRDEGEYPYEISLVIEEVIKDDVSSEKIKFENQDNLAAFISKMDARLKSHAQCCHWNGFDLEIMGDTGDQIEMLRTALNDWRIPKKINISEIWDLSNYSERVEGFGVEKPYYSPFISRKNEDGGWFPENIEYGFIYTPEDGGETIAVVLDPRSLADFRRSIDTAKAEGKSSFNYPGCPKPVPVEWAEEIADTLDVTVNNVSKGTLKPTRPTTAVEHKGLIIKPNVESLDYEEHRGSLRMPEGCSPKLPKSLRKDIELKSHQKAGVAWLQHLWALSPADCRGVLLADDMGLGKTIQLLTFIAEAIESNAELEPCLIVAPVSLLENWKEEIDKFFVPRALPVLTLYGQSLSEKRLSRNEINEELVGAGINRLLKRDWLGESKVVLTTYETLRDLEFSLALQKWSVIVCDEAQKIKNPNAMVTRAAKKQNARFKIACTGTPVENTLTDIWCLFDFVQPGLLGALKVFGEQFRNPIERDEDRDAALKLDELRRLIEPQKLRRMKTDVAKDLPRKIEVSECKQLPLSDRQRALYADAVSIFRQKPKSGAGTGLQSPLGLLLYLRNLCSDPIPPGSAGTNQLTFHEVEKHSPKISWMIKQLEQIRRQDEKVIVFCEFRSLQRTLQRLIAEKFSVVPDIINGDTSAATSNSNNRQRRIKAFQEKPGFGVIILSPLAVGFGVNIQAANHVIHFTRTWNPAKEDQATDRAYRIGQTKDVYVYYPVVVAEDFVTFDAKLDKLLAWKRELSTDMLSGTGELKPSDFGDLEAPGGGSAFGNEVLTPFDIEELDPEAFEAFCAILWSKLGYSKTIRTPKTGDGGVDVVAISGKVGVLIQCKSSTIEGQELGWEAVKDVVGGAAAYTAKYPGIKFSLVAVTNRRFNRTAHHQANINNVELIQHYDLAERLVEKPVTRGELASYLLSGLS